MKKYDVARQHYGDRMYHKGDVREMAEKDAARLVSAGVLVEQATKPAKKAEPAPKNKAEDAAPKNKAAPKAED